MTSTRRTFLQKLLITGAALGLDPAHLARRAQHYGQALAASSRKLALLVGINRYPGVGSPLQGCLTDVELQRELLIHHFGFQTGDILTLTQEEATIDHLTQAIAEYGGSQPTETLIFHFSGYGRLIQDPQETGAMIPALMLTEGSSGSTQLSLRSLFDTLSQLSTPQVTSILDCGFAYADPLLRGGLRLRSQPALFQGSPVTDIQGAALAATAFPSLQRGLMLSATTPQELAAEAVWSGFSAGILTYLLTQYLWESTPADKLYTAFDQITTQRELSILSCQKPSLQGQGSRWRGATPYFLQADTVAATGFLQDIKGNRGAVWLGGIPPAVLCGLQTGTVLVKADAPLTETKGLTLRSRSGLVAQVSSPDGDTSWPPLGTPLREQSRILSNHLKLWVGLDDTLGRIEKVDITSALSELGWAEVANPRDQQVDCLVGKLVGSDRLEAQGSPGHSIGPDSYGLFWPGRQRLVKTFGSPGEAARSAIQRLAPRMQHLLAAKRLRTTFNGGISQIALSAALYPSDTGKNTPATLRQRTAKAPVPTLTPPLRQTGVPEFSSGDILSLELNNAHDQDLYVYLVMLDSAGQLNLLAPSPQAVPGRPLVLASGSTAQIPPPIEVQATSRQVPDLFTCHDSGLTELFVLASMDPYTQSLSLVSSMARELGVNRSPMLFSRPLDWVQAVLTEITQPVAEADMRRLGHTHFASLSMVYGVT